MSRFSPPPAVAAALAAFSIVDGSDLAPASDAGQLERAVGSIRADTFDALDAFQKEYVSGVNHPCSKGQIERRWWSKRIKARHSEISLAVAKAVFSSAVARGFFYGPY